jgi:acyl carrier protein
VTGRTSLKEFSVNIVDEVKAVVGRTLQLGSKVNQFDGGTGLFGSIPEFDSMAVVTVVAALEERFDIVVEDDDITAETFETVGSLAKFVEGKLAK